jgi:chromosome partitioning protein
LGPTNPAVHEATEAQQILGELPEFAMSAVIVRDRKVYRDAMLEGRGVVELPNEKASAEIEALAREIYEGGEA